MTMNKDPYQILGLSRNASSSDIQAAYRKLAKQYHPDRNIGDTEAQAKFIEVQEAYDTLNDPRSKNHFDQFGFAGSENSWTHGFTQTMHNMWNNSVFKGRNIQAKIDVTLEEIASGCIKTINVNKNKICNHCEGSGAKSIITCNVCNGSGVQFVKIQPNFNLQSACNTCNGSGKISSENCEFCKGSGYDKDFEIFEIKVNIPAGSSDGTIKFAGQGEPCKTKKGMAGDLIVFVNVAKHEIFHRQDNHLIIEVLCSYTQLYKGFEIELPTVYKEKISVKIPAGTYPNSQIRIARKGLTGGRGGIGDMFIIPKLDVPRNMPDEYNVVIDNLETIENKHISRRRQDWQTKISKYF